MRHAILTEGGLVRTLKAGCPEQTMHLYWTGGLLPREPGAATGPAGEFAAEEEYLIEIELLRIEGNNAIVRINAPPHVDIVSAKRDPRCQGSHRQSAVHGAC
jgi:hypothetical protein